MSIFDKPTPDISGFFPLPVMLHTSLGKASKSTDANNKS